MCYTVEEVWELEFQNENGHLSLNLPQPLLESHSVSLNLRFIICKNRIILYDQLPCISDIFTLTNFQLINTTFTPPLSSYTPALKKNYTEYNVQILLIKKALKIKAKATAGYYVPDTHIKESF